MEVQLMLIRHASEAEVDPASEFYERTEREWSTVVEGKSSGDDLGLARRFQRNNNSLAMISARLSPINPVSNRFSFLRKNKKQPDVVVEVEQPQAVLDVNMFPRYSKDEFEFDMMSEIEAEKERKSKTPPMEASAW